MKDHSLSITEKSSKQAESTGPRSEREGSTGVRERETHAREAEGGALRGEGEEEGQVARSGNTAPQMLSLCSTTQFKSGLRRTGRRNRDARRRLELERDRRWIVVSKRWEREERRKKRRASGSVGSERACRPGSSRSPLVGKRGSAEALSTCV